MSDSSSICFSHCVSINAAEKIDRFLENIVTAHNLGLYEWKLKLNCEDEYAYMRGNQNDADSPRLCLESSISLETTRTPVVSRLVFHVAARKEDGEVLLGPSKIDVQPLTEGGEMNFTVPMSSPAGRIIHETADGKSGAAVLEITVWMHISKASFDLGQWRFAAPPITTRDFRFAVLDDQVLLDVSLVCTNGVFRCNRQALFQISGYFRRLFVSRASEFQEDCSLAGLTAVLTYMLTGFFTHLELTTPKLVEELVGLIRRYRPPVVRPLFQAIEQTACEQLERETDNLEQIIKWFLVGGDCDMHRLKNAALAALLTRHLNDFAVEFVLREPAKPHLRELHERLTRRQNVFRAEPMQKILRIKKELAIRFTTTTI